MKKVLALTLALAMLALAGCGGGSSSSAAPSESGSAAPSGSEAAPSGEADLTQGDKLTIRVSHAMSPESSYQRALEEEFKKPIEEKTGGRITVELYPSSQLGAERQSLEGVGLGTMEMCVVATPNVANIDKNFQLFDFPFLFSSTQAGYDACDGEIGDALNASLLQYGYRNLGFGEVGMRYITNSKQPISKPEDLKGMKIRCMENPMSIAAFQALGANPTPMALNELFTGLQQKTVDGQENPPAVIYDNKFHEVQQYMSMTGHFYHPLCFIVSSSWFDSLSAADQELVAECGKNAALRQREFITADNETAIQKMTEAGLKINELTDEERQAFVDAVQPVYDEYKDEVDPSLLEKAQALNG